MSSCKALVNLIRFYSTLSSLDRFSKNAQMSKFTKFCPVRSEVLHADAWMGRHDKANSRFSQFCKYA